MDPVDLAYVVEGEDVRVRQGSNGAGLALEAGESARIVRDVVGENLDGDVAPQPRVARAVNLAHTARAQRSERSVGTEARPISVISVHLTAANRLREAPLNQQGGGYVPLVIAEAGDRAKENFPTRTLRLTAQRETAPDASDPRTVTPLPRLLHRVSRPEREGLVASWRVASRTDSLEDR